MLGYVWVSLKRLINQPYKFFAYVGLTVLVFFLYFWRLDSLTKGLSQAELSARAASNSLQTIVESPLNAPYHFLQYLLTHFTSTTAFYLRLPSAILAVVLMWAFYYLAKAWFGKIIGVLSALIAASTPLVILSARSATPGILLLSPLALLAIYTWLEKPKTKTSVAWMALCLVAASTFYIPGGVWLVFGILIFKRRRVAAALSKISRRYKVLGLLISLLLIVPLVYGLAKHPSLIRAWLLIPSDWPSAVEGLSQLGWAVLALTLQAPSPSDLIIGRLPILDAAQIILLIFGTYAMGRLARAKIYSLVFLIVLGLIASGLNHSPIYLMFSLAAIFMLVAAGLRYLFVEWRKVFPRNPIPKYLALALMSILVGLHITYGLNYSLSAWPNTPSTKSLYVLK
ncbi:glycosyltransferase family 39 protein [Candidatus Saccharibacteria bacterium]|nr:glycosyltransferase family 39 protein [Candidatus Saccharibacteria bacterium]